MRKTSIKTIEWSLNIPGSMVARFTKGKREFDTRKKSNLEYLKGLDDFPVQVYFLADGLSSLQTSINEKYSILFLTSALLCALFSCR